jgi:hypothetical protein
MTAYRYANIKKYLHGIAFKGGSHMPYGQGPKSAIASCSAHIVLSSPLTKLGLPDSLRRSKEDHFVSDIMVFGILISRRTRILIPLISEAALHHRDDFAVIALNEEPDMKVVSHKKFQRAQNRSLTMPIFKGDEDAAMNMIGRRLNLSLPTRVA